MTWKQKYQWCVEIAALYNARYAKDIVHDSWVYYFDKTKLDLFEVPLRDFNQYAYTVVKKSFYRWWYHERIGSRYAYFSPDELQSGLASPEEALFARDLYDVLLKKLKEQNIPVNSNSNTERLEHVFRLKSIGYTVRDIADELNISKQAVTHYNKKMSLINPFNGNKLKISRIVTKKTWDDKDDQDDYERDDYNEYYELYKHKESGQGLLVRLGSDKKIINTKFRHKDYIENES